MNFGVGKATIGSINSYGSVGMSKINSGYINQEYEEDFFEAPETIAEKGEQLIRKIIDDNGLTNKVNGVFVDKATSSYWKNTFYILAKSYPKNFGKSEFVTKNVIGIGLTAAVCRSTWYLLSVALTEKEFSWFELFKESGVSAFGKDVIKETTKKGFQNITGKSIDALYNITYKIFPNLKYRHLEKLELELENATTEEALQLVFEKYDQLNENIARSSNILSEFGKKGSSGYLFGKNGAGISNAFGEIKSSYIAIRDYLKPGVGGASNFKVYFKAASTSLLKDIGSATLCDYAISLIVNVGTGVVNNISNGKTWYEGLLSIGNMKYGSTFLSSAWKAIGSTAGGAIGYAIAGPTGAKWGKIIGTFTGANISKFVQNAFEGDELWCAIAGGAAVGGAVVGGAIATALIVGGSISAAFPVGTIVGVAIIVGAVFGTFVAWIAHEIIT